MTISRSPPRFSTSHRIHEVRVLRVRVAVRRGILCRERRLELHHELLDAPKVAAGRGHGPRRF
jgi:hypothetical protein